MFRRSRHGLGGSWKFLRAASEALEVLMDGFMPKYHHFKHQTDGYFMGYLRIVLVDDSGWVFWWFNGWFLVLNMTVSEWRWWSTSGYMYYGDGWLNTRNVTQFGGCPFCHMNPFFTAMHIIGDVGSIHSCWYIIRRVLAIWNAVI